MSSQERKQEIRERAIRDDPLINPNIMEQWVDADLPLRGPFRERVSRRLLVAIKERRTVSGISQRIASQLTTPITNAVREETEGRVQSRIQETIQNRADENSSIANVSGPQMGPGLIRDIGEENE